jgi:hypothetical protein
VPSGHVPDELFEDGLVELVDNGGGTDSSPRAVLSVRGRLLANEVAVRLRY